MAEPTGSSGELTVGNARALEKTVRNTLARVSDNLSMEAPDVAPTKGAMVVPPPPCHKSAVSEKAASVVEEKTLVEEGTKAVVAKITELRTKANVPNTEANKVVDKIIKEKTDKVFGGKIKAEEKKVALVSQELGKVTLALDEKVAEAEKAPAEKKTKVLAEVDAIKAEASALSKKIGAATKKVEATKAEKVAVSEEIKAKAVLAATKKSEKPSTKEAKSVKAPTDDLDDKQLQGKMVPLVTTFKGKKGKQIDRCEGIYVEKTADGSIAKVSKYTCPPMKNNSCPTSIDACTVTAIDAAALAKLDLYHY